MRIRQFKEKMFKFDFDDESQGVAEIGKDDHTEELNVASEVCVTQEHFYSDERHCTINSFVYGLYEIKYMQPDMKCVHESSVLEAETQHSDLISGKYEGGFKIWECTHDLARYMCENISHMFQSGVTVLDLGCGAGILGILAILHGCTVHFQDYNDSVLKTWTIPNYLLNVNKNRRGDISKKCRFFAGDWLSFVELTCSENLLYDVILTSETIYNADNYLKLHTVFKEKLKGNGNVYP